MLGFLVWPPLDEFNKITRQKVSAFVGHRLRRDSVWLSTPGVAPPTTVTPEAMTDGLEPVATLG